MTGTKESWYSTSVDIHTHTHIHTHFYISLLSSSLWTTTSLTKISTEEMAPYKNTAFRVARTPSEHHQPGDGLLPCGPGCQGRAWSAAGLSAVCKALTVGAVHQDRAVGLVVKERISDTVNQTTNEHYPCLGEWAGLQVTHAAPGANGRAAAVLQMYFSRTRLYYMDYSSSSRSSSSNSSSSSSNFRYRSSRQLQQGSRVEPAVAAILSLLSDCLCHPLIIPLSQYFKIPPPPPASFLPPQG